MSGKYDCQVVADIFKIREDSNTRGHNFKIYKAFSRLNIRKKLLHPENSRQIHSYTYKARYLIYAIANQMAKELHPRGKERARLQYARWGNEGSQLMYIYRNNIYYAVNVKQALNKNEIQLTQDGNVGVYFNGIPDWLYEEEIFKSNNAVWWSPKGDYLCYASINDSKVQSMVYPIYGPFSDPNNLYPRLEALRYPKRSKENAPGGPEGKAWVEMFDPPVHGAYKYYLRLPIANSRSGYFQHIAKLKFMENRKQFLTRGEYEVTKIISFDRETETLFYIANRVGKAGERHLYSVADHRFTNHHEPKCLTCDIGNECLYNDAKFSPNHKYYILECLGPGVPYSALYRIHNNTFVKLLDQNDEVRNFVAYRAMPQNRTFLVPLPSKFTAVVRLYLPPTFREADAKKYPMVVEAYGGPGTQNVKEEFKVDWSTYLTSKRNFIYAYIDGRGSGFRGDRMVQAVYKQLGQVDVEDQLSVAKLTNLRFADDVVLFSESPQELQLMVEEQRNACNKVGLEINLSKTKVMFNRNLEIQPIMTGNVALDQVDRYTYLGQLTSIHRDWEPEVRRRVALGWQAFGRLNNVWHSKLPLCLKQKHIGDGHTGGYVVTRAMTSPYGNSFQCGIAVAPVTSWLYQDSFYTERYMQTFEENRIGYLDADALLGAADLKDKKFLLIHGSADDHVHFQQSMMLAMALNSNGVMYRSQFYPDESHDLAGVKEHLYRTMGGFLDECFEQSEMDFYS
ncbi:Inactive dipeptidyl peptidase 10 [Nymphon striatum]|nr:Inactive dipeptidyl peptidase 10 [Nymphon striatum]